MVELIIETKIVDEQLLAGKKIEIIFNTPFNKKAKLMVFPDDFSPELQGTIKQIYELAVYGSEVGNDIFKCSNDGKAILINGYKRIEPTDAGTVDFDNTQLLKLKFTRFGMENRAVEVEGNFNSDFTPEQLQELKSVGIEVIGKINQFEIISFDGDISLQIHKAENDSFIDLGDFKNGKLIFTK